MTHDPLMASLASVKSYAFALPDISSIPNDEIVLNVRAAILDPLPIFKLPGAICARTWFYRSLTLCRLSDV